MGKKWVKTFQVILLGLSLCCVFTQAIGGGSPLVEQLSRRLFFRLAGSPQKIESFLLQVHRNPVALRLAIYAERVAIARMCEEFRGAARELKDEKALEAITGIEDLLRVNLTPAEIAEKFNRFAVRYADPEISKMLHSPVGEGGGWSLSDSNAWQMEIKSDLMEIEPDLMDVWVEAPNLLSPEGISSLIPPYGKEVPTATEKRIAAVLEAEEMHRGILQRYGISHRELAEDVGRIIAISHRLIEKHDGAVSAHFGQVLEKLKKKAGKLEKNDASLRKFLAKHFRDQGLYYQIREMLKEVPGDLGQDVIEYALLRARMQIIELKVVTGEPVYQVTHRLSGLLYERILPANEGVEGEESGGRKEKRKREEIEQLRSDISRLYAMTEWWMKLANSEVAQKGRSLEESFYRDFLTDYKVPRHLLWRRIIRAGIIGTGIAIGVGVIKENYELFLDIISDE